MHLESVTAIGKQLDPMSKDMI